jgi:hypothetical protein
MPWSLLLNKWAIVVFVILSLGAALFLQTARLDASVKAEKAAIQTAKQWEANFKTAQEVNADNLKALDEIKAENARIAEINAAQIAKYNRLGKAYESLKIKAASDQSPLSESWRGLFDGLRSVDTWAGDNQDSGRTPANP